MAICTLKKINDHSSMMGYLNRHHPVYTFEFKASQKEAMTFKNYGAARKIHEGTWSDRQCS